MRHPWAAETRGAALQARQPAPSLVNPTNRADATKHCNILPIEQTLLNFVIMLKPIYIFSADYLLVLLL